MDIVKVKRLNLMSSSPPGWTMQMLVGPNNNARVLFHNNGQLTHRRHQTGTQCYNGWQVPIQYFQTTPNIFVDKDDVKAESAVQRQRPLNDVTVKGSEDAFAHTNGPPSPPCLRPCSFCAPTSPPSKFCIFLQKQHS